MNNLDFKLINKIKKLYINGKSYNEISYTLKLKKHIVWKIVKDISRNERIKLPQKGIKFDIKPSHKILSEEKARLIAYLSSDGHVSKLKYYPKRKSLTKFGVIYRGKINYSYKILFYNSNKEVVNKFISDFKKVYGIKLKYNKKRIEVACYISTIYNDLIKYTSFGSREWRIPKEILFGNKSLKSEWIKAFCDAEAHVSKPNNKNSNKEIVISSTNFSGLKQIKELLNQFNISSYINGPYERCYRLKISKYPNLVNFREHISFYHKDKLKKMNFLLKD